MIETPESLFQVAADRFREEVATARASGQSWPVVRMMIRQATARLNTALGEIARKEAIAKRLAADDDPAA